MPLSIAARVGNVKNNDSILVEPSLLPSRPSRWAQERAPGFITLRSYQEVETRDDIDEGDEAAVAFFAPARGPGGCVRAARYTRRSSRAAAPMMSYRVWTR
jgi:hypothetical protein